MATGHAGTLAIMVRQIAAESVNQTLLHDQAGNSIFMVGSTVPADGEAGMVKGACFLKVDPTGRVVEIYNNTGTVDACNFDLVSE